ncbi:hypothetical protein [Novosphingobium mathurense]|uniref:DUF4424 domain-containing protein n=1 Tax=Novosphingobium mathurense TaxID=428990 RepID=A0A1U6GTL0_9SPHN|nr:hypothetical protein [Novosphingobium mathurense]SLJ86871.1 hypothetical protein SAMN06295987_101395 [Novosphingobium mathurense]
MNKLKLAAGVVLFSISTQAAAEPKWLVQPIQNGEQAVRYEKGVPTVDMELRDGVVQITPLPFDHGSLVFGIAVYNDADRPANIGIENVHATFGSKSVPVFSKDELVRRAKNRATWSQIGLALVGGLAAAGAASQRDHYRNTFITPHGTYRSYWSMPSAAGQFQATAIAAGTGVGIAAIQSQLDRTVEALGDQVVQLTTVDPGESYAGKIVIDKVKPGSFPAPVTILIDWNGERYPFTFQIAKPGTPAPTFTTLARSSDLTDFRTRREASGAEPSLPATVAEPVIQPAVMVQPIEAPPAAVIAAAAPSPTPAEPVAQQRPVIVAAKQEQAASRSDDHAGLIQGSAVKCVTCRK